MLTIASGNSVTKFKDQAAVVLVAMYVYIVVQTHRVLSSQRCLERKPQHLDIYMHSIVTHIHTHTPTASNHR